MSLESSDEVQLPLRDDQIYKEIASFEPYQLRNNIAFEVLVRTDKYKKLTNMLTTERIQSAIALGFNENDAKYAGLPWGIFKIFFQKEIIDKNNLPFDIKMFFRYLISIYKNDDSFLAQKVYSLENLFSYFTLEKEEPLDFLLEDYDLEDVELFRKIIDDYCNITYFYINNCDNEIEYKKSIERAFQKMLSCNFKNEDYLLDNIIDDYVEEIIYRLDGYKKKIGYVIGDIVDGLERLVSYYVDFKKVYTVKGIQVKSVAKNTILNNKESCVFVFATDKKGEVDSFLILLTEEERNFNQKDEVDKALKKVSDIKKIKFRYFSKVQMISPVDDSIPLNNVSNDFLESLSLIDYKSKMYSYSLFQNRPNIKLNESNIVNIKIDMNLPKKEFMDNIEKIKDHYDESNNIPKTFLDLIDIEKNQVDILKIKKKIAESFFCFDYYTSKVKQVNVANTSPIVEQKKKEIKEIKKSDQYTTKEKNAQIAVLNIEIKETEDMYDKVPKINKGSDGFIFKEESFQKFKINPSTAYGYYTDITNLIKRFGYNS